ncbi:hypothetical protein T12_14954 [Trichinella patagoniensis]|uniref:Uncharacterized protein n=1 Tax=Trichinella patagoniensis TaxID=990121 RepID=A0A0V0Z8B3_9BILA|nr:hypothetical protein T12_14954 [Trichinella patagoniensis]
MDGKIRMKNVHIGASRFSRSSTGTLAYLQSERLICTTNGQAEGKSRLLYSFRRFWKKTVLEELTTVYKSGWIITVNDEGQWQLNFRGQVVIFLFDFGEPVALFWEQGEIFK